MPDTSGGASGVSKIRSGNARRRRWPTMGTVTIAVHRIIIRDRVVVPGVVISNKVRSMGDFKSRSKTPSESRVEIVDPRVNDSDSDPLA